MITSESKKQRQYTFWTMANYNTVDCLCFFDSDVIIVFGRNVGLKNYFDFAWPLRPKSRNKVALKHRNSLMAPPNVCSSFSREIAMACQQQRNRCSKFCPKTTVSLVNYRSCSFCNKLSIPPRATNNGLTVRNVY